MKINKLSVKQKKETGSTAEKRTSRQFITWFIVIIVLVATLEIIYSNWCEIWCEHRYKHRMNALYGKVVPYDLICMSGNVLTMHKPFKFMHRDKELYVCGDFCEKVILDHFETLAYAKDTISGDLINKAAAVPGLRQKNKPGIIYFEDMRSFQDYYNN